MKPHNSQNVDVKDLGFGSKVTQQSQARLLNRDGSFNVNRFGLRFLESASVYHWMLTVGWGKFYAVIALGYLTINIIFATAYYSCGPDALLIGGHVMSNRLIECFFFSIQTLSTIGYGRVSPVGVPANTLVAIEALTGLLGLAFATGLSFARFSRPNAKIIFSKRAVIAPYRGIQGFQFRIINARTSQIIEMDIKVVMSRLETNQVSAIGAAASTGAAGIVRRFYELPLERHHVPFFPLNLTVVHPIDESSPLNGFTKQSLIESDVEFIVLLSGVEETFVQQVHTRSSYKAHEVIVGAKFADMYIKMPNGDFGVDVKRLHEIELMEK